MNNDGAPGPDEFGAHFFQTYWQIVNKDVVSAVLEFFTKDWLLPNFNSNAIILIPKVPNADEVNQYRPVALANFKFKIITKVMAERLARIMPSIISSQQRGFIQGRQIKECISLTSEAINLLQNRSFGGNLAMKIDISKAFDTLDWSFLLNVLKAFGFCHKFCSWIETILNSAYLSISINGKLHGYFQCKRGVRQGDPLSPLLFCIAEEVLSRSITKLVEEGKLELIRGSRSSHVPSHVLYADDIMVFCKGKMSGLVALQELFNKYAMISGQRINVNKSTIYAGAINHSRLMHIVEMLGFKIGSLPFTYLGVPIFKGKPKQIYLQPIADRIKLKLSAWKASLLSIAGRLQLVHSVVHSMLIHTISIYSLPTSLIKDLEKCIRNFIWSGDIDKWKLVTVAWSKLCKPFQEGGLGLKSLKTLNKAANIKLCWDMVSSDNDWATLLKSRVIRKRSCISYHINSSIWSSIKGEYSTLLENTMWIVGDGKTINFWNDNWCGAPISQMLNFNQNIATLLTAKVSDFIVNGQWDFPLEVDQTFPTLRSIVTQVSLPFTSGSNYLVWKNANSGALSLKDAYLFKSPHGQHLHWTKQIWSPDIPPSKSLLVWRMMHNKIPTDDQLMLRGLCGPSMCSCCRTTYESTFHLFFECILSTNLWRWLASILNMHIQFTSLDDIWLLCDKGWSPQGKVVIQAVIINIINVIWYVRNQARFQDRYIQWRSAVNLIISNTSLSANKSKKVSYNSIHEFSFMKALSINLHPPKTPNIIEVIWQPPPTNWIKCNIDGAAAGTPSAAACGGIFRNMEAICIGCFAQNLGNGSSLYAELSGAMKAIEIASYRSWNNLWIETDSMLVLLAFKSAALVPWSVKNRWNNCIEKTKSMNFLVSHIYIEGNSCADKLANLGLSIPSTVWFDDFHSEFSEDYIRNMLGLPSYRFVNT